LVVDVGAHVGEFSSAVKDITDCTIYAFEPIPAAFELLNENLHGDKFFSINQAVSLENGQATFHITESLVGSSLLPPVPGQTSTWLKETGQIEVASTRLDTFIESNGLSNISLLKTDAEGCDLQVLESAGRFLTPTFTTAVLVEMSFHVFHEGQDKFYKVIELLSEKGYFLAGFYPHFNHNEWLWWADVLFLPNNSKYSTNL
jgi:FkbM family methyltransferase